MPKETQEYCSKTQRSPSNIGYVHLLYNDKVEQDYQYRQKEDVGRRGRPVHNITTEVFSDVVAFGFEYEELVSQVGYGYVNDAADRHCGHVGIRDHARQYVREKCIDAV